MIDEIKATRKNNHKLNGYEGMKWMCVEDGCSANGFGEKKAEEHERTTGHIIEYLPWIPPQM